MVTKLKKASPSAKSGTKSTTSPSKPTTAATSILSASVKDSAQQIWQAGLGAFTKAQVEGTKAYESLVKEGVSFQRKTQSAAEEKITEATQKMSSMATEISSKASGQWDKLENIFEDRVAKALNKLGVPSAKDINALIARIDALNASVQKLSASQTKAPAKSAVKSAVSPAKSVQEAPKSVAKKAARLAPVLPVKAVARKAAPRKKVASAKVGALTPTAADQVNPNQ